MAEYIEREKVGLTDFEIVRCNGDYKEGLKLLLHKIESIPAADVRPVKRGKWEMTTLDDGYGEYQLYKCDKCGALTAQRRNFCPNCGADMREEQT